MTEPLPTGTSATVYVEEITGLDELLQRIPDDAARHNALIYALNKLSMIGVAEMRKRIPVRTGATRRTITFRVQRTTLTARVGDLRTGTVSRVATWLNRGTGIFGPHQHVIVPVHARALAWPIGRSGIGGARADMARRGQSLRRTGQHTTAYHEQVTQGGANRYGGMAVFKSVKGMQRVEFFMPAYAVVIGSVTLVLSEVERTLYEKGFLKELLINSPDGVVT